ncbi:MAG: hypothetical protein C4346_09080, partial [Chloroflexota bacterium]
MAALPIRAWNATGTSSSVIFCTGRGSSGRTTSPPGIMRASSTAIPHRLLRAVDARKDQSYVLYTLTQEQLGMLQFPLGNLTKPEVRTLARAFGLPVAEKAESQEICFVGKGSYADFVAKRRPDVTVPGEIVDSAGHVLGEHKGLVHHTVGQRKG